MRSRKARMQIPKRAWLSSPNIKLPDAVSAAIDGNRQQEKDFGSRFFCDQGSTSRVHHSLLPGRPRPFQAQSKTNFLSHLRLNLQTTCRLTDARSLVSW